MSHHRKIALRFCLIFLNLCIAATCIYAIHFYVVYRPLTEIAFSTYSKKVKSKQIDIDGPLEPVGVLPEADKLSSYKNFPFKKKPNVLRIGCFGDSHTYGSEVGKEQDFPSQLQKLLGNRYEVLNFGRGAGSSNQMYKLMTVSIPKYEIDIIILGPRGFYPNRAVSFNTFWSAGFIPALRYKINDGKLVEIHPPGENFKERIKNYYSIWPTQSLLFFDNSPPSFLKSLAIILRKDLENPFYYNRDYNSEARQIQNMQIREIEKLGKPIFHITDSIYDFNNFKHLNSLQNYQIYQKPSLLEKFLYRAEVRHSSPLGNYRYALNLKDLILKNQMPQVNSLPFTEEDEFKQISTDEESLAIDPIPLEEFYLNINGQLSGRMHPLKISNAIQGISELGSDLTKDMPQNEISLVGIYFHGEHRANSIFFKMPFKQLKSISTAVLKIEQWKQKNVYFIELPSTKKNENVGTLDFDLINSFSKEIYLNEIPILKSVGNNSFKYIAKPYRILIDRDLSVESILHPKKNRITFSY